jgi:hypothetical protein
VHVSKIMSGGASVVIGSGVSAQCRELRNPGILRLFERDVIAPARSQPLHP